MQKRFTQLVPSNDPKTQIWEGSSREKKQNFKEKWVTNRSFFLKIHNFWCQKKLGVAAKANELPATRSLDLIENIR